MGLLAKWVGRLARWVGAGDGSKLGWRWRKKREDGKVEEERRKR